MWNNLRARHYSVLILLAIVALETSAIAIDKFINRESEVAFTIESPFQNNPFIQSFKMADASCAVLPVKINRTRLSTPAVSVENMATTTNSDVFATSPRSVSAEFIAAANKSDGSNGYIEYAVQPGDSLSNIASLFGSAADTIKKANKIDDKHAIKAGQTIKVPMPGSEMFYTVREGDSLSKIASRFRIPLKTLIEDNNLKTHMLMAEQRIRIPINGNKPVIQMIKADDRMTEAAKKLEIVKEEKAIIIPEQKLQMIKADRVQIAQAPASKPNLDFIARDLLKAPPAINQTVSVAPIAAANQTAADNTAGQKEVTYTVAKGDTLLKIAQRFNTTAAKLQEVNNIQGHMLKIGQEIKINPDMKLYRVVKTEDTTAKKLMAPVVKASEKAEKAEIAAHKAHEKAEDARIVEHKVQAGESLSLIARRYRTTISAIVEMNNLASAVVKADQNLKIPTSSTRDFKVVQGPSQVTRASMKMPVRGRLSDKFGWRKHPVYRKRLFHAGIDIAAPKGAPIAASMNGKVIYSGRRSGYGNLVIVSHAGGFSTRYAHCSTILVKKGQMIKAGQLIARVGATGVATGNHLHFEVRKNGKPQNPLTYLK